MTIGLSDRWFISVYWDAVYFRACGYGLSIHRRKNGYVPFSIRMGLRKDERRIAGNWWLRTLKP
jgi:hypothetical protein